MHAVDPYAPPEAPIVAERKAYSLGQVLCGTFFGSLFCTAVMIRSNLLAFGRPREARLCFGVVLATAILVTAGNLLLPGRGFTLLATIASLAGVSSWYQRRLAAPYAAHVAGGGPRISWWWVVALILLCTALLLAVGVGVMLAADALGHPLPD